MSDARFEKLTEGQRACLRLVYERREIKQIARELGIALPTVNQRLAAARRVLGTSRSIDAARMLHEHEGSGTYIRPIYTPGSIDPPDVPSDNLSGVDRTNTDRSDGEDAFGEYDTADSWPLSWPLPTRDRPRNDLGLAQRLAWIVIIAAGSMVAFGVMISSVDTLSRLL